MIEGVQIEELKPIVDTRGFLMEIFRESLFGHIKQVYITSARPGVVKDKDSFHQHHLQNDHLCCLTGEVLLVLVDTRAGCITEDEVMKIKMGEDNPKIVVVPRKVLHAFKNIGDKEAIVLNCITKEYTGKDEFRIKNKYYDWDKEKVIKREFL